MKLDPFLKVFIGWDSKEPVAWQVSASSILRRATIPVALVPLTRRSLGRVYTRDRSPTESTEFSLTRFLVPHLSDYQGISIFMDCDMLVQVDLLELWLELLAQPGKAVWCCPHDYIPNGLTKFDGHEQTTYPRKNWSSFMVFNNAQCEALSPEYINRASGLELHRMHWVEDDAIGHLPLSWNHLVGEYPPSPEARILHYTNGTPCFPGYERCDQADRWWEEYRAMLAPAQALLSCLDVEGHAV